MTSPLSSSAPPSNFFIDPILIFIDNKLDYLPFVSTATNTCAIALKVFLRISGVEIQSDYLAHLKKKSLKRCLVALFPGIGNSILLTARVCLRTSKKPFNKELYLEKILPMVKSLNENDEIIAKKRIATCVNNEDRYLDLNQLNLLSIPEELFRLQHLQYLGIAHNKIKRLPSMPYITHIVVDFDCGILRVSDECKVEYSFRKRAFIPFGVKVRSLELLQKPLKQCPSNALLKTTPHGRLTQKNISD